MKIVKDVSIFASGTIVGAIAGVVGSSLVIAVGIMHVMKKNPDINDVAMDGGSLWLYKKIYGQESRQRPGYRHNPIRNRYRQSFTPSVDELLLPTRTEAEEVVDKLFDMIEKYERVTVSDLYELAGHKIKYGDDKWGWSSLKGADVTRVKDGYRIDLPMPEYNE